MAVMDALKASPLLKGFTDTGLQILAGVAVERQFPKGVPLFVESMIGESLFVIASGRVQIASKSSQGEDTTLGELGPGGWLGELSLIQPSQRMCTATALTEVTAVELRHADFQKLMAQKPQACIKLLMAVVSQFGHKVLENREALRTLIGKSAGPPKG